MIIKTLLSVLFICLTLLLFPAISDSSEAEPIWVGKIIMEYRLSNSLFKETSDDNSISRHKLNEDVSVRVVIKACGKSAENLRIGKPEVNYILKETRFIEARKAKCVKPSTGPGDKNMVEYKTPGSRHTYESSFSGMPGPEFPDFILEDALSVDPKKKSYILSLSLKDKPVIIVTGSSHDKTRYVCEKVTTTHDMTYEPLVMDIKTNCDKSGNNCSSTLPAAPRSVPLMFSYKGSYSGGKQIKDEHFYPDAKSIYGSFKVNLDEIQEGLFGFMKEMGKYSPELQKEMAEAESDLRKQQGEAVDDEEGNKNKKDPELKTVETLNVRWEFDLVTECEDLIDELKQSISVLRAYADDSIFKKAAEEGIDGTHDGDGNAYDDMVGREGYLQYMAHWWDPNYKMPDADPDILGTAEPDMGTNNDCKIENYEKIKADYKRKCFPGIIFEAIHEHEKLHVQQCSDDKTGPEFKSGTPKSYQKFELEAHCLSVGMVLNYAKEHCKDCDLAPYEKEYKRICGGN